MPRFFSTTARPGGRFLARCVRGIEWLLAAEVRGLGAEVLSSGHRVVDFSLPREPSAAELRLGSADDVFLFIGEARGIDHRRASLSTLSASAARLPLEQSLVSLPALRSGSVSSGFTVVASFLGARNYNRYAVEESVAEGIRKATGLEYESSRDRSPDRPVLSFRVHLVHDMASFSVRIFDEPLHRRRYKQRSYPGTLHPPLAHAMALLAGIEPNQRVLDPFCGVGTLLLEARSVQGSASCYGVDIDPARVGAARENAELAGLSLELGAADAAKLPFASASFERVLTNLPWGVAVEAEGELKSGRPELLWEELARVLRPGGRAVVLTDESTRLASGVKRAALTPLFRSRLSLFGQHPELWVLQAGDAASAAEASPIAGGAPLGRELLAALPLAEQLPLDFGVAK